MKYVYLGFFISFIIFLIVDLIRILKIKTIPSLPQTVGKELKPDGLVRIYEYFRNPKLIPEGVELNEEFILSELEDIFNYINTRYDCSDFWAHLLFRLYKDYKEKLPQKVVDTIKDTLLNFKYWMDMPEDESMCFFSENHTILFSSLEYLVGQEWQNETFRNSGFCGAKHMERGKKRLLSWFDQKFKYGFFEWYSNCYYNEDLGPLGQLLDYSEDEEILKLTTKFMDLFWYEVASHSVANRFVAVSSRMYSDNKSRNVYGNRIQPVMNAVFNNDFAFNAIENCKMIGIDTYLNLCHLNMLAHKKYKLPEIIREIYNDTSETVIKSSNGLNPEEYKNLGLIGQDEYQIISQFSNEIFVNRGFAHNTYKFHKKNHTFASAFSFPIKFADLFLVKITGAFSLLCNILDKNFIPTGSSLNRGNVYTYRKNDYMLSTAVKCKVDYFGNQHHIATANISEDFNVFTLYPASVTNYAGNPGYWGGNRRMPMGVQDKSINLTIYKMGKHKRLGEGKDPKMTHSLFPKEKFDKCIIDGNYAFGKYKNTYVALICNKELSFKPYDFEIAKPLVQRVQSSMVKQLTLNEYANKTVLTEEFDLCAYGEGYHMYVTELSDVTVETFDNFVERIRKNRFAAVDNVLYYSSKENTYQVEYNGDFKINNVVQELEYKRLDSKYCHTEREATDFTIKYNDKEYTISY